MRALTIAAGLAALAATATAADHHEEGKAAPKGSELVGAWDAGRAVYTVMPDGHIVVMMKDSGKAFAVMTYEAEDGEIEIEDVDGFTACVGMKATYAYETTGDEVTFTAIEDPCEARTPPDGSGGTLTVTRME